MTEGTYWSKKMKTSVSIYNLPHRKGECEICGKECKNPIALIRIDDEDMLEHTYGSCCIKKLKLELIESN